MNILGISSKQKTSFTKLLIDLTILFFLTPLASNRFGYLIISFGFLMTNLLVVNTLSMPKLWIYILRLLAGLSFILDILYFEGSIILNTLTNLVAQISYASFLILAILAIGSRIFSQIRVDLDVINGGICIFILLGFLWLMFYQIILIFDPDAFHLSSSVLELENGYEIVYYSFTTLTTLGYGDIVPVNKFAMTLAISEAIVGLMYPSIFIARLVGLYTTQAKANEDRSNIS
ncbi:MULTISPECIES: potassium channel family protein [unclassified Roseofilum]|uniref:potassium channel family protein n=1 Tax=unclassified Roseofilum TaxID=2620099 RepID=UPI000E9CF161|nr:MULTISPECIES: potassium channel family protein [unclassified Roseofilum]MBP0010226.1 two pore domain potassium channel family protein [Roseofilum sp. Belize Diploria]MBP0034521.1 two pore domain potassium channel family protein [Roseofilum sp. Belize BBD 4]HBQ99491.1 two pore domain potassium channel family protein [Cyanobacteria bacterium UBA11691]